MVSGGGVGVEVGGPGHGHAAIAPPVILGFGGGGVLGTKAMCFSNLVVSIVVVVVGCGAIVGGIALGQMAKICCWVVLMEFLFLDRRPLYAVMKVGVVAMVRCHGAACHGTSLTGGMLLPVALDRSALAAVNLSMESITQV